MELQGANAEVAFAPRMPSQMWSLGSQMLNVGTNGYCSTQQNNRRSHMFRGILYSLFPIFWGYIKHLSSTRKESGTIKASPRMSSPQCVCGSGSRFMAVIMEAQWVHCNTSTHSLCHLTYFMCQSRRGKRKRLNVCVYTYCVLSLHPSINITFSQFVFCFCYTTVNAAFALSQHLRHLWVTSNDHEALVKQSWCFCSAWPQLALFVLLMSYSLWVSWSLSWTYIFVTRYAK